MNRTLYDDLGAEAEAFAGLFGSDDQREGMAAFIDKRPPTSTGSRPGLEGRRGRRCRRTGRTAASASVRTVA